MNEITYRCSAGETFDSIALRVYGDEKYASELLNANTTLCRIMKFTGGEILTLPVVEVLEDEDMEPVTAPWKEG